MTKPEKVADSLIMSLIIHSYIGWGSLYVIKFAINHLTNNAYIGLFPAAVIIIPFFWMACDLARIYPDMSITAIFSRVFGKCLGKAIAVLALFYLIFFEVVAFKDSHLMIYSYFFAKTPLYLITAVFIAGTLYLAVKGIQAISRLAAFMLIPPLCIILLLELLGLTNIDLVNIRPVLSGLPWRWLPGGLDLTLIFVPGAAIFFYMPYLNQTKSIKKISLFSLGIVFPLFFLALFGTIGAFGPALIKQVNWPMVEFVHLIDYPSLLLEKSGVFFLIAWYAIFFSAMAQGLFLIGNNFNLVFPKIARNWYIVAASVIVFIAVNIPLNIISLEIFMRRYQTVISVSFLSLFFITWAVAKLKTLKKF